MLTSAAVLSICLTIFSLRRWAEAASLLQQANTDSLTGLFNRRKGWEVIEQEMNRARRYHRPVSLIMFDIDHFKAINDTYGHLAGDHVLKTIAKTIQEKLRSTDTFVRWGGEEFMIISAETDLSGARQLAERLRKSIENCSVRNMSRLTASFGVTQFTASDNFDSFTQRVDAKLYDAKSTGRNKVA